MVKRTRQHAAELREIFGTNMRVERARKKMTLEELAHATGTSASYLSRIERGKVSPTLDAVAKIAAAFSLPPGKLLDDTLNRV